MPCNYPIAAWRAREPNDNGKLPIVFTFSDADTSRKVNVPCGRCIGCRLERSRQWATRIVHESKMHDHNWFATLTYDDDQIPDNASLQPEHFVLFMKRLRHKHPGVRFYQAGEYGETTARPHHHAILFNCQFTDLKRLPRARDAHALYASTELETTWTHGICTVGAVTFQTAAYVASYVTQKVTGERAAAHYLGRHPEYATMSRRPGIGRSFLEAYKTEIWRDDSIIINNKEVQPPEYYDRIHEAEDPDDLQRTKEERASRARSYTHRQRIARERNAHARIKQRNQL